MLDRLKRDSRGTRHNALQRMVFQRDAVLALQASAEDFLGEMLGDANLCALHAKRVTIYPRDLVLVKRIKRTKGELTG